jgi:hypothetical protein
MWRRADLKITDVSERKMSPPSSEKKKYESEKSVRRLLIYYPEDGGDTLLRNVGSHKIHMTPLTINLKCS